MQIANVFSSAYAAGQPASSATRTSAAPAASVTADANTTGTGVTSYDFTSMTPGELRTTVNDLVKSGKLSLKDSSPLVTIAGFGGTSPGRAGKPIDVLAALKAGIAYKQQNQADQPDAGLDHWKNALAALQGLQGTTSGVDTYA